MKDDRIELIYINVWDVKKSGDLHRILKEKLDFPEFYGNNWDAFWDVITGIVELPKKMKIYGWRKIKTYIPKDCEIFELLISKYNEEYGEWKCEVIYKD